MNISYTGLHMHLVRTYGNAPLCIWGENHTSRLEWANVSGVYTKNLEDYLPMCASCHRKFDITEETRTKNRKNALGNTHRRKTVHQYTLTGEKIATFESLHHAAKTADILVTSIANNLGGRSKSAGGFLWKY